MAMYIKTEDFNNLTRALNQAMKQGFIDEDLQLMASISLIRTYKAHVKTMERCKYYMREKRAESKDYGRKKSLEN